MVNPDTIVISEILELLLHWFYTFLILFLMILNISLYYLALYLLKTKKERYRINILLITLLFLEYISCPGVLLMMH